jgi:hypothetical protein
MSIIQRRPWNSVSDVTPVTMHPKRYMIAVYRNTKTHSNLFKTKKPFLLQALSISQAPLVKILGKKKWLRD